MVFITKPMMTGYEHSIGKKLLAMYIPLSLSILYLVLIYRTNNPPGREKWLFALLYILLLLPFYNVLLNTYQVQDDALRYHIAAENIAANGTLWGSDDLIRNTNWKVYQYQPGYRYYLAAWLAIAGKENRLFQFINMAIYLAGVFCLLANLQKINMPGIFKKGFLLFLLLSSFTVTTNVLTGLMEWLVITLLFFFAGAWLSKRTYLAVVILALIPFLRQNLLVAAVLLFIWLVWQQRYRLFCSILFTGILLLPLYHNLYYAGQWKFISTYHSKKGYLVLDFGGSVIKTFFYHILLYAGVDWLTPVFWVNALAVIFIPLGTVLYVYCIKWLKGNEKWVFLCITLAAIVPTLIFGGRAYYPRFEWVNLQLALVVFWLFLYKRSVRQFSYQRI